VATFLSGLDNAVVATATPTVVGELGGLSRYAWVFTAYLLSSTASLPLYGKLADLYGRKRVFLGATTLFAVGSALCGLSPSMEALIAFRFVQGLGAGGLFPVTLVIIGDTFPLEQRARLLGLFSALWGVADVLGPGVGGFLTEQVSWRWVFYLNLPLCLASMLLVATYLNEEVERKTVRIDYPGATLLVGGITGFLLALQGLGGVLSVVLLLASAVLGLAFVVRERRAPEPLLPFGLFRQRLLSVAMANRFLVGVVLYGQPAFVPPFLQGAMGIPPTLAGFVLSSTSIGWAIAANASGRAILRSGYRASGGVGATLLLVGFVLLRLLSPSASLGWAATIQFVIGLGFGAATTVSFLAMQNAVEWDQRGIVTSVGLLALDVGGTLGVSVAGAVFGLAVSLGSGADVVSELLPPERGAALGPVQLEAARRLLASALEPVYTLFVAVTLVGLGSMALLPRGRPE
jgi:EmrB/QacA subfamily drug resistance transporter